MSLPRQASLYAGLEALFPERHLYIRSRGRIHAYVLSSRRQLAGVALAGMLTLWLALVTAGLLAGAVGRSGPQTALFPPASGGAPQSLAGLASTVEKRHAALALLLADARGAPGAAQALAPALNPAAADPDMAPAERVALVRLSQDQLVDATEDFGRQRAGRLRLAYRLAGLEPEAFAPPRGGLGGPLIEAGDPRALADVLDVDDAFAGRIQQAAASLAEADALEAALAALPLARPTDGGRSSGFGVRADPFTRRPAFHTGLDFSGRLYAPVAATAPGVVAFTGLRSGYGRTVEVDHGQGFKTRYAHLSAIAVRPGQRVVLGQRLGGMGSTGRSTGVHLHYEVWVNGRPQNPDRFLKAGDHVRQAS